METPTYKTYRPNMKEFEDFQGLVRKWANNCTLCTCPIPPLFQINRIESEGGHKSGICKIIPPEEWIPRKEGYRLEEFKFDIERPIKQVKGGKCVLRAGSLKPLFQEFKAIGEKHESGCRGYYQTKCMGQVRIQTGKLGLFGLKSVQVRFENLFKEKMSVLDYYHLSQQPERQTPSHVDEEDLEARYWKLIAYNPPICKHA